MTAASWPDRLKVIADSNWFNAFILIVIVLTSALVGLETIPEVKDQYDDILRFIDKLVLGIFILEMLIKIGANGKRPWRYFYDRWNVFDFVIVMICLLPLNQAYVVVIRLARVFRALRLVRWVPRLQLLVGALLKSLPSIGYVVLLLGLIYYMYAVMGTHLFRENDPKRFGSLDRTVLTLFEVSTLEAWVEIMDTQILGSDKMYSEEDKMQYDNERNLLKRVSNPQPGIAPLYFGSFIMIGTYVVLNLCVGVILNGMQEAHEEEEMLRSQEKRLVLGHRVTIGDELDEVKIQLKAMQDRLMEISLRARNEDV